MLGAQEEIVHTSRQHWLFIFPRLAFYVLLAAAIIVAAVLLAPSTNQWGVLVLVLLVFPIFRFVADFCYWYNLRYIVTSRRVIETRGTIRKMLSDSSLDKVNDVILTQSVMGRIMSYGDIKILTASESGVNILRRITDPLRYKRAMLDQREGWVGRRGATQRETEDPTATEDRLLSSLEELHERGLLSDAEFKAKSARLAAERHPGEIPTSRKADRS